MLKRPRRNRKSSSIRSLIQETELHMSDLVAPLFIIEGKNQQEEVLPGIFRYTIDQAVKEAKELYSLGILAVDLFSVIPKEKKTPDGKEAFCPDALIYRAIQEIKSNCPDLCVMVDVALDPFTSHGHDGLIDHQGNVLNDPTLDALSQMALLASRKGADVIAPSDMMDGRVGFIRKTLDQEGFCDVSILSYAVKYASCFYGPFRDIVGAQLKGDKKTYQMNPANRREAIREALLDEEEGADFLLIKPALLYLDVISKVKEHVHIPVGGYHVSGEYAMVLAAAKQGWLNAEDALLESLIAIKRAGADFIFTYAAKLIKDRIFSHRRSY